MSRRLAVAVVSYFLATVQAVAQPDFCRPGYAREQRLPASAYYPLAQSVFAAHSIAWERRHEFELDHTMPLCLGGSNDASNLVPQPMAEARLKDRLEWYACRAVCDGTVSLSEVSSWFADPNAWRAPYRRTFGEQP